MDKGNLLKCLLPYFAAVISFVAVSAAYFSPQFEGKEIVMHDITQYKGSAQDIARTYSETGREPQWTGNMFGGMPAYLIGLKYNDSRVVSRVLFKAGDFMGRPASMIFMAMLGFFVMLMMWGVNPWAGIAPSLAYGLSTYFLIIIGAGHITKMVSLAYIPLMIGAVFYTFRRNMWLGAAFTALFAMLEIAAGHPQITYYFAMVLLAYWISELAYSIKNKILPRFTKATGLLAIAILLAIGANLAPLWYISRHAGDTIRGGSELSPETRGIQAGKADKGIDIDYATAWSYGKLESFNMLIPNLMGGSSSTGFDSDGQAMREITASYAQLIARQYNVDPRHPQVMDMARTYAGNVSTYWGDQPVTAGPTYIGAVVIFLCMMGLFMLRGRTKWWTLVISVIAIFLSWGHNMMWFTELFYNWFPGYNRFRTVAMILVIVEWSVPFIAALMLHRLWKGDMGRPAVMKALKMSTLITGGVVLFFAVLGSSLLSFTGPNDTSYFPPEVLTAMRAERAAMMRADAWRSLILILLGAGTVWLFARDKIRKGLMVAVLAVLVVVDLYPVGQRFMSKDSFVEPHNTEITPTEADLAILADSELGFRVLNTTVSPFNDATTSYFHRSVGGYSGAKLQRYQDLIDLYLGRGNQAVLDMLNTKYVISRDQETGRYTAVLNPDASGAAWFVRDVKYVEGPDAEILALGSTDLRTMAVIDRARWGEKAFTYDSIATIELIEYRPDRLVYRYYSPVGAMAIFSEIFYEDGWSATIDGQPAEHFRANYILRGMVLPAGEHIVEFTFEAPGYRTMTRLTFIFSLVILAAVAAAGVSAVMCRIRRKKDSTQEKQ